MRLAVCDDDVRLVKRLKPVVYQYANENRFEMVIDEFFDGESLLASKSEYDMIFLDYRMKGINGMDTAKKLRERNLNCTIVFMTSYPDFVYDAFKVNAFRFCRKPVERVHIYEVMDDYFAMFGNDYPILLKHERETIQVETKQILYIEAMGKYCVIHRPKDQIRIAKLLGSVCEYLPKGNFFRAGRSFVVNFNYIAKYDREYIYMKNGDMIPQSRMYASAFKEAYMMYAERMNPTRRERH
jgi:DNA-binding LytR/AlgR family response regulator